jgi:hypothetical protein
MLTTQIESSGTSFSNCMVGAHAAGQEHSHGDALVQQWPAALASTVKHPALSYV